MPDKAWKKFEREVARRLGGVRVPVTGLDRAAADVDAGPFKVQCKLRRNVPAYLTKWLDGITMTAAQSGSTGIVVWRAPNTPNDNALVILKLSDWTDWHGSDQAVQTKAPECPEALEFDRGDGDTQTMSEQQDTSTPGPTCEPITAQ